MNSGGFDFAQPPLLFFLFLYYSIEYEEDNTSVTIIIKDTGVGMYQETLDKIYNMEIHHVSEGTAGEKGTGIGLILSKEFIESNKGKLQLQSNRGEGTIVTITLPKAL